MKKLRPKFALGIMATMVVVSGVVYAASVITGVKTQTIGTGDAVSGWYQDVNDRMSGNVGLCSLNEYQLKNFGCPVGSIVHSVNDVCGEGTCDGATTVPGNSCAYFDWTHAGQPQSTSCY